MVLAPNLLDGLGIVGHQLVGLALHAGDYQRIAAAPFILAHDGEIDSGPVEHFDEGARDILNGRRE